MAGAHYISSGLEQIAEVRAPINKPRERDCVPDIGSIDDETVTDFAHSQNTLPR
jgi:hypothetical protein